MKVLIDTPVWSLALRKKVINDNEQWVVEELAKLIENFEVTILGAIRQEVLSGISDDAKFQKLKKRLEIFEDAPVNQRDYENAAQYSNICRKKGIQGSAVDFLICTVAARDNLPIFTLDKDFDYYAQYLPIKIYQPK